MASAESRSPVSRKPCASPLVTSRGSFWWRKFAGRARSCAAGRPAWKVCSASISTRRKARSRADGTLIYEGPAYGFLARRSAHFLKIAGMDIDAKNAFVQTDADYLPIPFAQGLKVTWEGSLNELHFYHLQVREYAKGTAVQTFDPKKDLKEFEKQLLAAVAGLTQPTSGRDADAMSLTEKIKPDGAWVWTADKNGPGACEN